MKTTTVAALSLATLAIAQPSGHRRHQHLHEKRDDVVVTVVDYVTSQMPDVVVYVDEDGNVLSSVTSGQVATAVATTYAETTPASSSVEPTSTSVYVAPTSSTSAYVAPASSAAASSSSSAAASSAASSTSSSAAASSSTASSGSSGYGIVYSPYTSSGSCKTADQVAGDFESISGYDYVRSYGVDCDQVSTILAACKTKGMKLWLGIYDITATSDAISTIISAVGDDWDSIHTVAVGNEGVNSGTYTVDAVVAAIGTARTLLGATGFSGNIVTVDTFVATIANPELCENSDFAAVNAHPFFDGGVAADGSGPWLVEQMQRVSSACGGKNTWITETGWPTQGDTNGKAVPGQSEQTAAISSIKGSVSDQVILFTAFNDLWKTNSASTFNAEQYWGMYGTSQYN